MNSGSTFAQLKSLEPMLRADGVCGLYLFGSRVRGNSSEDSDVDLMFDISPGMRFSLFDQARISRRLSEALHAKVDFIPRRSLHPLVKVKAEADCVTIFG